MLIRRYDGGAYGQASESGSLNTAVESEIKAPLAACSNKCRPFFNYSERQQVWKSSLMVAFEPAVDYEKSIVATAGS